MVSPSKSLFYATLITILASPASLSLLSPTFTHFLAPHFSRPSLQTRFPFLCSLLTSSPTPSPLTIFPLRFPFLCPFLTSSPTSSQFTIFPSRFPCLCPLLTSSPTPSPFTIFPSRFPFLCPLPSINQTPRTNKQGYTRVSGYVVRPRLTDVRHDSNQN